MTRSSTRLYYRLHTPEVLRDQVTGTLDIHFSSRYRKQKQTQNGVEVLARRRNASTFPLVLPKEFLLRPHILRDCLYDCFTSRRLDIDPQHLDDVAHSIASDVTSYPSGGMGCHMVVEMQYLHLELVDEGRRVFETRFVNMESIRVDNMDLALTGGGTGASKRTIEKLIKNGSFVTSESDKKMGTCSICLEELSSSAGTQLLRMDCSHVYHRSCLLPWLEKRTTCPNCRRQLAR